MRLPKIVCALALLSAGAAAASPADGRWRTQQDGAVVEVADCGQGICGRVISSARLAAHPDQKDAYDKDPALRDRPIRGLALFEDMRGGPKVWKGKVYNPGDGGTYAGTVTLADQDTLKLRGCVFYPLCLTQTWTRMR